MKVGVVLPIFAEGPELALEVATAAEAAGVDGVFCYDHLWPMGQPERPALAPFPVLAAVAGMTEHLWVGTLVARVGLVANPVLEAQFATLELIAPGRVVAGLGTGDRLSAAENRAYGIPMPRADLRRAWLAAAAETLLARGVPVWIGGGAPATAAVAEVVGAALNQWASTPAAVAAQARRTEVTWAGPAPEPLVEGAVELAVAGASWMVVPWPVDLDQLVAGRPGGHGQGRAARLVACSMEFRRVNGLPPYVFATINDLKAEARRAGADVIDLGFGNPDLPSPEVAVEKLAEAAHNPRNHRYSASKGIPKLRSAIADLYARKWGVELDPECEVVTTIGAKEGLSHLMWVLVGPGDTALVPSPSYPIHIYAPLFAGADVRQVRLEGPAAPSTAAGAPDPGDAFFDSLMEAWESTWPKPRVIVLSFPHNPTTACVDLAFMERLVAFAREHEVVLVHDFAYADLGFDGYEPPSILQVPGAKDVAVELYTLTKSFSMAGWRVGFMVGNAEIVQALTKLKSYLDYGTFQPIQIAAIVAMNEAPNYPVEINHIYKARRDALCDGLNRIGWELQAPRGTMFVWAPIPEPYAELGSLEFAKFLVKEAAVATSPGVGFGPGGDGHVRFALIENDQRIGQAVRNLRKALPKLG